MRRMLDNRDPLESQYSVAANEIYQQLLRHVQEKPSDECRLEAMLCPEMSKPFNVTTPSQPNCRCCIFRGNGDFGFYPGLVTERQIFGGKMAIGFS